MSLDRIYRVQITAYPRAACAILDEPLEYIGIEVDVTPPIDGKIGYLCDDFQPDNWNEDRGQFYWPSTKHLYRSRSAALRRKQLIESYGATAVLLVSELVWQDDRAVRTHRRIDKAHERAEKLRRQADQIIADALATTTEEGTAA